MGKTDIRHKKKCHKKKNKREKKRHKDKRLKKHKRNSSTSNNESDIDSSNCGYNKSKKVNEIRGYEPKISESNLEESAWVDLFSGRHTTTKVKNETKKENFIIEKPGQSSKELNPYWKDGGNGLPPSTQEESPNGERNHNVKLLQSASITSNTLGIPYYEVKKKLWHPLEKSGKITEDTESGKLCFNREVTNEYYEYKPELANKRVPSNLKKCNFLKPGEGSDKKFTNTHKQNWRKKEDKVPQMVQSVLDENIKLEKPNETLNQDQKFPMTQDELNLLAAKKIKAEIMGDNVLAEKIGKEIEMAKSNMQEHVKNAGSRDLQHKREDVVIVRRDVLERLNKHCRDDDGDSESSRKKQKSASYKGNEKLRNFMDNDKYNLKSMFEKEKYGAAENWDNLFVKFAKKDSFPSKCNEGNLDDDIADKICSASYETCQNEKERMKILNEEKAKHKSWSHCVWCLDGKNVQKHLILSVGSKCYLCLPNDKSLTNGHCLIVPTNHDTCGTLLDEDVWNEMDCYRNRLSSMFENAGQDVIFFESARSFAKFPHMILHCVPVDKEIGALAPIYFKKAIMESETEWSNNKKLIDLRKKDLRRSIPKGLPYFAVDFGREGGFAHVIEDEKLFPQQFAEEIIAGMLDLDPIHWRNRNRESLEAQKEKARQFLKMWKHYELSESRNKSDSL